MKMSWLMVASVIVGLVVTGAPIGADNTDSATFAKEAFDDLLGLLKKADQNGFRMEPKTTTMFGGWLPKGNGAGNEPWVPMLTLRNVSPNKQYRIIASGDNDTTDLDLRVVDPAGKIVAIDGTVFRDAEVTFRPARQQDYVIELRLYKSRDHCVCMGAILLK
jgi:hypothetical protein